MGACLPAPPKICAQFILPASGLPVRIVDVCVLFSRILLQNQLYNSRNIFKFCHTTLSRNCARVLSSLHHRSRGVDDFFVARFAIVFAT